MGVIRIIGGELSGRRLTTGEGPGYRPATGRVREAVFNMLAARGLDQRGARVVDVFAGSGSLGIEALSRGADHVLFIERERKEAARIAENLKRLGVQPSRWRVEAKDFLTVLDRPAARPAGLVFVDPPYGQELLAPAVHKLLVRGWLASGAFLVAEVESGLNFDPETYQPALCVSADKTYGQTRIIIWQRTDARWPSSPAPSTPCTTAT